MAAEASTQVRNLNDSGETWEMRLLLWFTKERRSTSCPAVMPGRLNQHVSLILKSVGSIWGSAREISELASAASALGEQVRFNTAFVCSLAAFRLNSGEFIRQQMSWLQCCSFGRSFAEEAGSWWWCSTSHSIIMDHSGQRLPVTHL